jgi:hypothetical protein
MKNREYVFVDIINPSCFEPGGRMAERQAEDKPVHGRAA